MFPHKVGSAWEINAPAKLNLYLEVLGPPQEGFHPLETLMVPVGLFDQLRWTNAGTETKSSLSTSSELANRGQCSLEIRHLPTQFERKQPTLSADNENLILKAAHRLGREAGIEPFGRFELVKRIPMQAGLGGGSSDAAAALLLANEGWGLGYSRERLMTLAADLGSDVPYFLGQGTSICRGRGELIEPVPGIPRMDFVIVKPPVGLATAEVFSHLQIEETKDSGRSQPLALLIEALGRGAFYEAGQWMSNRLEEAAAGLTPWIERLRTLFSRLGCYAHQMTGSGSSYVGVMRSAKQARQVARQIAGMKLGNVFVTASC